jgi:hypothetical protein
VNPQRTRPNRESNLVVHREAASQMISSDPRSYPHDLLHRSSGGGVQHKSSALANCSSAHLRLVIQRVRASPAVVPILLDSLAFCTNTRPPPTVGFKIISSNKSRMRRPHYSLTRTSSWVQASQSEYWMPVLHRETGTPCALPNPFSNDNEQLTSTGPMINHALCRPLSWQPR